MSEDVADGTGRATGRWSACLCLPAVCRTTTYFLLPSSYIPRTTTTRYLVSTVFRIRS